jgi:hypothetical protein
MADTLLLQNGCVTLTTEEGATLQHSAAELEEMFRGRFVPPLAGQALPDGVKFLEWREPRMVVVHQTSPCVRRLRWIAADSPVPFGPGATYRHVELSLPYAITFAVFDACGDRLQLGRRNELYFVNRPLRSRDDDLGFPALLNVSKVQRDERLATWICTQHLKLAADLDWTMQLDALVRHTFDGSFNLSSEHHEGSSWFTESRCLDRLGSVEEWCAASQANSDFGLSVPWLPAPVTVGGLIEELFRAPSTPAAGAAPAAGEFHLIPRFLNFLQLRKPK